MLVLKPGDVFERDFQVVRPLSEGGMGLLWVVKQISTGKKRALKLMLRNPANDDEARRRFAQEARVGSMIESEHIVEVIAAGVDTETNTPWLIMELLEGEDLATILERGEVFSPVLIHDLFQQLCHALAAAHDLPVVHRDLKPENIFLAKSRVAHAKFLVKLLDFGIAKVLTDGASSTGSVGTPLWMPPEQAKTAVAITPAADVWSLGLLAFYLLTGKIFWLEGNHPDKDGDVMALLREVLFDDLPIASARAQALGARTLPDGFDAWFARCVNREPTARFQNAREVFEALSPILRSADNYDGAGEFTLRVRTSSGGDLSEGAIQSASRSNPSKTGGPFSVSGGSTTSASSRKKLGTGVLVGGAAFLVVSGVLAVVAFGGKKEETPVVPTATALAASTPTTPSETTTDAPATTAVIPSATAPTSAATTTSAPTIKTVIKTVTAPPSATAPATTTPTPTTTKSNPLNMGIQ